MKPRMNTNIYLVRHAQSIYTPDELNRPLSEKGFKDAEKINEILLNENIAYVLSSPYKRAIQTVQGVAKNICADILIEDGFKERKIAEGSVENFNSAIDKLWTNFDFNFEGGESNLKAQKRGIHSLNKVLNKYNGKNIVIGTHGNIMVLIMNYFDNKYNYDFWKGLSMPDVYRLSFQDNKFIGAERIVI
jgi:2,3-bisphosphoglycerate-dependent phosphoglycerate mutase